MNLGRCGHCLGVVLALVLRAEERPDRCKFVVSNLYLDFSEGTFAETCTICPPGAAEQVVQNGEKVPPEKWSCHLYSSPANFRWECRVGSLMHAYSCWQRVLSARFAPLRRQNLVLKSCVAQGGKIFLSRVTTTKLRLIRQGPGDKA